MPEHMARANAAKSAILVRVEHVFVHQKKRYGLFIRSVGIARAQAKLTLDNLERFPHILTREEFLCRCGSDSSSLLEAGGQHGWRERFLRT